MDSSKNNSHLRLYAEIRQAIESGRMVPGERLPGERILATSHNIPVSYVRRALKMLKQERFIELREKAGAFVCGFTEMSKHEKKIGFLTPELNEYMGKVIDGVNSVIRPAGFNLVIAKGGYSLEEEVRALRELLDIGVKAIIGHPFLSNDGKTNFPLYREISSQNYSLVFLSTEIEGVRADFVSADSFDGAYKLTDKLIKAGHRRILLLLPYLTELSAISQRLGGYRRALQDNAIPFDQELVVKLPLDYSVGNMEAVLEKYVLAANPATAAFSSMDPVAMALLKAAYKKGINIPGDFSVVSFSCSDLSAFTIPSLTVAQEPTGEEIGKKAAAIVLDRLSGKLPPDEIKRVLSPVEIVERETVRNLNDQVEFQNGR